MLAVSENYWESANAATYTPLSLRHFWADKSFLFLFATVSDKIATRLISYLPTQRISAGWWGSLSTDHRQRLSAQALRNKLAQCTLNKTEAHLVWVLLKICHHGLFHRFKRPHLLGICLTVSQKDIIIAGFLYSEWVFTVYKANQ